MKKLSIIIFLVSIFSLPVNAQLQGTDILPNDGCTATEAGRTTIVSDADGDMANVVLICNGTTWQPPILEFPTSASSQTVVSDDVAAAQGFLDGTYDNYPSTDTVIIGKNTSDDVVVGGFYEGGSLFTGVVAGPGYSGFIGQTYTINDLSNTSTSGIFMRDIDEFSFKLYGEEYFRIDADNGYSIKMRTNTAAPRVCAAAQVGLIALTSFGTLCTCTTAGAWRNAANTANCVWQ